MSNSPGLKPGLPGSYLVLETTNRCSLACVHCSVSEKGHAHHQRHGFLPYSVAENLFSDLSAARLHFQTLILFWLGEPLLHPQFADLYRLALRSAARDGTFSQVEVHSNATHLDAALAQTALNRSAVRQVWHFSLDAARRETYRHIKGVDRFALVEANVEAFLDAKKRTGAPWPRVVFQFIVSEKNAGEVEIFRDRWLDACRRRGLPVRVAAQDVPPGNDAVVYFRQLDCPTAEEQSRENTVYRRAVASLGLPLPRPEKAPEILSSTLGPCGAFWKSPVIGWDGRVTTCTRDNRFENCLGSLSNTPFSQLWSGRAMQGHRENVAQGVYGALPACEGCFVPRSSNHPDILPAEISAFAADPTAPASR